jgi:hypothetical protein
MSQHRPSQDFVVKEKRFVGTSKRRVVTFVTFDHSGRRDA